MVGALLTELELRNDYIAGETVPTVYFGGGTPSLLSSGELRQLLDKIRQTFPVTPDAEITLEANPDDITEEILHEWKDAGINRLSIGVQGFFEEDLRWMNRAHDAAQAIGSLRSAIRYFDNITIDLIYGTPLLTNEKWKQQVETAVALGISHLSCYALTVEPKTPLDKMIRLHKTEAVDPDQQSEQFLLLMQWMEEAGYEHYEISNFAKPGRRSRHNAAYWQGEKYLGIGPSAHSYNGYERQWNISNNAVYIQSVQEGKPFFEKEELTRVQQLNEYIMTSLRTMEGLLLDRLTEPEQRQISAAARRYTGSGHMRSDKNSLILTREGKLLADGIAADLFFS